MSGVLHGIARNKSVVSLNLSRNMMNVKSKNFPPITEAIVQLLQDEETAVQKISTTIKPIKQKKIHSELFDGSLLPTLSKNYKLIIYFEMKIYSHYLIHDKKGKQYYYVTNKRKWDKKNNEPISKLLESFIPARFEKKPSKPEFFKAILSGNEDRADEFMEKNKAIEYEKREKLWEKTAYVSSEVLDYINL